MKPRDAVAIVGASAAGLAVAESLRRQDYPGDIHLIGDEIHLPYDRPPLSKELLAGVWPENKIMLREPEAIDALRLSLHLGTTATALDVGARTVRLSDGNAIGYDDVVITTGARARTLPGTDQLLGVHTLRTIDDIRQLKLALPHTRQLVIVGAGFLGAEAAAVIRGLDIDVTLVSDVAAPLSDVIGPDLGQTLIDLHTEHGVKVIAGVGVRRVIVEDGRATGVLLADGRALPADQILVSIGSIPNTEWLAGSGLAVDNGVLCDEYCRAAPGVWAAGDVARWRHPGLGSQLRIEHRTNASEQGLAVGRNLLAAQPTPFAPIPYIWSDQYDRKIQIYGLPRGADSFAVIDGSVADRKLVAVYGRNGTVCAAVGINMVRGIRQARALLTRPTPWTDAIPSNQGVTA